MNDMVKVMVVDDEENVLSSVQKVLGSKFPDYQFELIKTPEEALCTLKDNNFDLVITDLMMPGIDGLELIKQIRATNAAVKIIMMTGYATMKTALLAMREGANKYISKPFTRDELVSTVISVMQEGGISS